MSERNGGRRGRGSRRRLLVGAATLLAVLFALGLAARGGGTTAVAAAGRIPPLESPVLRSYTLGQFFDIWGQPLGKTQVGPDLGPVTALVDGTPFGGDPPDIRLDRHTVLQLDVGAAVPFRTYSFPAGL